MFKDYRNVTAILFTEWDIILNIVYKRKIFIGQPYNKKYSILQKNSAESRVEIKNGGSKGSRQFLFVLHGP